MGLKKCVPMLLILLAALTGCGRTQIPEQMPVPEAAAETQQQTVALEDIYVDAVPMQIAEDSQEEIILEEAPEPAIPDILEPVASGEKTDETETVLIDYSHTEDGYIMVLYKGETSKKLKTQIRGLTTTYTYSLYPGQWAVYPLTDGNCYYQVKIFQNISGNQYSLIMGTSMEVTLADEFAPFLRPNQYVDYASSSKAVEKAWELTKDVEGTLEKVKTVYDFVVSELHYDEEKARTVRSGYVPELDRVLEEKKGICFDYASLMTGMLRSQGIPCKMVFGYAGSAYHAWISVWTEESGWVDGVIFFDGIAWQRLDPTFASSSERSESVMKFIGNGKNYREKYFY